MRKTFSQFCEAIYDTDKPSDTPLEVGRVGKDRRKSAPERKRYTKSGGYKARKDIGTNKPKSQTVQQPEKERGSARKTQLDSAKEERKKAALARIAAKKGGKPAPEKKKTPSASELLSKKTAKTADPDYKPQKVRFSGPDARSKRQKLMRAGEKELERRVREVEAHKQRKKPEDVELKNFKKSWSK